MIAVEGALSTDRRLIRHGALTWTTPAALWHLTENQPERRQIGTIDSIRRVKSTDGRTMLVATGTLDEVPEDVGLSIDVDQAEVGYPLTGEAVFNAARIRAVWVGTRPVWPECMLRTIPGDPRNRR